MKKKKKYIKPKIVSEKIIPRAGLACGKCMYNGPIFRPTCMGWGRRFS